jgi:alpha-mannosidase
MSQDMIGLAHESVRSDDRSDPTAMAAAPGYVLHVVAHSHWDREWYMSFQQHRARLVTLLDTVLDLLDRDPAFANFHLDGQTIVLDDYLEINPSRRQDLERYVRAGRLTLGPWYIQPDEFLVSGESLVRNLLIGIRNARSYGGAARVGYLPDTFGHISQMPQLLRGFGIDNAIFGRGLPVLGQGADGPQPLPVRSEVIWQVPDGSSVLGIVLAHWYNNAAELPTDADAMVARLHGARDAAASCAATRHLLLMNGMDHQPVQPELSVSLAAAMSWLAPDVVVHDSLPGYVAIMREAVVPAAIPTVTGELRGQGTDGWNTLANTASARLYLKRLNRDAQVELERYAEPLAALAAVLHAEYPAGLLRYAWMRLLQNQPHDSICGCSTDEVHEGMLPRFRDSLEVARLVTRLAATTVASVVVADNAPETGSWPILVANTLAWQRGGSFEVDVDLVRRPCASPPGPLPDPRDLLNVDVAGLQLWTHDGTRLPATVEDLGAVWDFYLPAERSRQPYIARRVRVRAVASAVPGLGYRLLRLVAGDQTRDSQVGATAPAAQAGSDWIENDHLRVDAATDGTLTITDKSSGERFEGLNIYEDRGDIGDEYIFRAPAGDAPLTTSGQRADSIRGEATPESAVLRVRQSLSVPAYAEPEQPEQGDRRSTETVALELETTVCLRPDGHTAEVTCRFDNVARDHRVRVLFPTGVTTDVCAVDSVFDVVERRVVPWVGWRNPTDPQPQQDFVDVSDGHRGLLVANKGLPEYEMLRDDRSTLALTLLRSVGRLGDWGIFPTPGAQCPGPWTAEYAIMPYTGTWREASRWAREFTTPLYACQAGPAGMVSGTPFKAARLPESAGLLNIEGDALILSACKQAEERDTLIIRLYNPTSVPCPATLRTFLPLAAAFLVSLDERRLEPLPIEEGTTVQVAVASKAIVTIELEM